MILNPNQDKTETYKQIDTQIKKMKRQIDRKINRKTVKIMIKTDKKGKTDRREERRGRLTLTLTLTLDTEKDRQTINAERQKDSMNSDIHRFIKQDNKIFNVAIVLHTYRYINFLVFIQRIQAKIKILNYFIFLNYFTSPYGYFQNISKNIHKDL